MNYQMGERKDGGPLNCKRNSIQIAFMKTWFYAFIWHFHKSKDDQNLVEEHQCYQIRSTFPLRIHVFSHMHNISKARWITRWESGKTGDAWTATEIQSNLHLWIHCFFVCMCIYKAKRMTRWESAKTGGAWTATEIQSNLPLWIRGFSHISYICKAKNKSARAIWKIPPPLLGKGLRPPALEGRARARARARAR